MNITYCKKAWYLLGCTTGFCNGWYTLLQGKMITGHIAPMVMLSYTSVATQDHGAVNELASCLVII